MTVAVVPVVGRCSIRLIGYSGFLSQPINPCPIERSDVWAGARL